MTIAQAERFYEQDEKKYIIENNKEFLNWLKSAIEQGYNCYIDTKELQEMINNITYWYEMKYPNRELNYYNGVTSLKFNDVKKLSNVMNIRQLLYRLPQKQLNLIECNYRAIYGGSSPIYIDNKLIGFEKSIGMKVTKKNINENVYPYGIPYFLVFADAKTGVVDLYGDLEEYIDKAMSLEELLTIFNEKYEEELDFTEAKETVYDHKWDIELRNRILHLVALNLLYSENTIPEYGYERAKRFINEFNKKLNLTLSINEIDEIINRDYTNGENLQWVTKTFINKDGREVTYRTIEDVNKKEQPKQEEKQESFSKKLKRIFKLK